MAGLWLTFILWSELFHLRGQGFIEALFSYDQRLTHCVVIIAHHTRVTPHLQAKWTKWENPQNTKRKKKKEKYFEKCQHTWWMKGSSGTPPARGRSVTPPPDPDPCNLLSMLLVWGRHMAPGRWTGPPPAGGGKMHIFIRQKLQSSSGVATWVSYFLLSTYKQIQYIHASKYICI